MPKITSAHLKKQKLNEEWTKWYTSTEEYYKHHKLPLILGTEKLYKLYGEKVDKTSKDVKFAQNTLDILKK